jgi:hypothetical protein
MDDVLIVERTDRPGGPGYRRVLHLDQCRKRVDVVILVAMFSVEQIRNQHEPRVPENLAGAARIQRA